MLTLTNGFEAANAHVRRVTLNLMRHASSCPDDVAVIADKLAANRWDWKTLSKREAEALFTFCTDDAARAALAEFSVDTATIHDLHRDRATADNGYIDDDNDTHCPLCGHKHIRWGFVVRNSESGQDFRCGSTCVEVYGLRVDGEAVAEAALKKLRGAISKLKKKATCEDWQAEHPAHATDMAIVAEALGHVSQHWSRRSRGMNVRLRAEVGGRHWDSRWAGFKKEAKPTVKYYKANGFLTQLRTVKLYGLDGCDSLVGMAKVINDQVARAREGGNAKAWAEFFALNPVMNDYQRRQLNRFREYDEDPATLLGWKGDLLEEVKANNEPPPPPAGSAGSRTYTADDITDLPF